MAANFTYFLSNAILGHILGKTAYSMPTVYVALSSTTPTVSGTNFTEPTIGTGGYARVATSGATWNAAASGSTTNAASISFPNSTAAWTSGASNLTYVGLYDAATAGNFLGFGLISNPAPVNGSGVTVSLPIGDLTVSLT